MEIGIIAHDKPREPSDKYGLKRLIEKTREYAVCPDCGDFLVFKDETRKTLICLKCDFEKPNVLPDNWDEIEPIEDWVAKKKKERQERS